MPDAPPRAVLSPAFRPVFRRKAVTAATRDAGLVRTTATPEP